MYDARDFAAGRRGLPSCADRIVDCDGDSGSLLADGATDERVTRSDCGKEQRLKPPLKTASSIFCQFDWSKLAL